MNPSDLRRDEWLKAINAELARLGFPPVEVKDGEVKLTPIARALLNGLDSLQALPG